MRHPRRRQGRRRGILGRRCRGLDTGMSGSWGGRFRLGVCGDVALSGGGDDGDDGGGEGGEGIVCGSGTLSDHEASVSGDAWF